MLTDSPETAAPAVEIPSDQLPLVAESVPAEVAAENVPVAETAVLPAVPASPAIDLAAQQIDWQQAAREAVARAQNLPPAVRAHFTRSLDDAQEALRDALGRPLIPVVDAVAALSAALPENWLTDPRTLHAVVHPGGDGFFDGTEGLSDARAAQIVRQQFAASGLLKADPPVAA